MTKALLGLHFSDDNWSFPVLDEHQFGNLHISWKESFELFVKHKDVECFTPDLLYFPALLFSVLAISLQWLPLDSSTAQALNIHTFSDCDIVSQRFTDIGSKLVDLLGRQHPTLTSVQYDLSKAMWLKNCGRGAEAWQSLGSSIRYALQTM